MSNLYHSTLK